MKRFDHFLISILWMNAVLIISLWSFDNFFRFNLMSNAHWRYLAELQIAGNVDIKFYAFVAGFILVNLIGLMITWHRKTETVQATAPGQPFMPQLTADQGSNTAVKRSENTIFVPERPPRLNLNNVFIPTNQERSDINTVIQENPMPVQASSTQVQINPVRVVEVAESDSAKKIRELLERTGFTMKNINKVGGIKLDFCAIGTDDVLLVGLFSSELGEITASEQGDSMWSVGGRMFKSPVAQMSTVVQKLQELFDEVLEDDLRVNIVPFVFTEGTIINKGSVEPVWNTLGINVFPDIASFEEFLSNNKPRELNEDEKSEFNAFSEFIDTVANHFSNV